MVRLFAVGSTVGPIVDSLHNQCLLRYDVLPFNVPWPSPSASWIDAVEPLGLEGVAGAMGGGGPGQEYLLLASSWAVPPLLGIAYVVLGGILPRLVEPILQRPSPSSSSSSSPITDDATRPQILRTKAFWAVTTTALIIKLSEVFETHPQLWVDAGVGFDVSSPSYASLLSWAVLMMTALVQWAVLDGTLVALLVASITSLGGPLSELPFVGHHVWTYSDSAADYFPLHGLVMNDDPCSSNVGKLIEIVLGTADYANLGLSSLTGPCYFAVCMDAIALGRWFDVLSKAPTVEDDATALGKPVSNDMR